MHATDIDIGPPLARDRTGDPALYGALGAVFHLEILEPDDEARLEKAVQIAYEWFGDRLRWTKRSCDEWVTPFRTTDLEYVSCYVRDLKEPTVEDDASRLFVANVGKLGVMDYEVSCNGAMQDSEASPYLLRFCTEIPEVGRGELYQPYAVLVVTVPESWPLESFRDHVSRIAAELRLRWGAAGLTYASWDTQEFETSTTKIYAHGRRHPGYDIGYFHADMEAWHDEVRSVNWLTFLGPQLAQKLQDQGAALASDSLLQVSRVGDNWCIQAGESPEAGDANRLVYPRAYVEADSVIRAIRASEGEKFSFLGPWNQDDITEWLQRFEKRVA